MTIVNNPAEQEDVLSTDEDEGRRRGQGVARGRLLEVITPDPGHRLSAPALCPSPPFPLQSGPCIGRCVGTPLPRAAVPISKSKILLTAVSSFSIVSSFVQEMLRFQCSHAPGASSGDRLSPGVRRESEGG
jgi:hypothetical protein